MLDGSPAIEVDRNHLRGGMASTVYPSVRRVLLITSVAACTFLLMAQVGAYLEFVMVPAPTPATTGPQGTADLVFGLLAVVGGGLGFLSSLGAGIVGLAVAAREGRRAWLIAISAAGVIAVVGLAVSAFVLSGLPRNWYHPFIVLLVVPIITLAFWSRDTPTAEATL